MVSNQIQIQFNTCDFSVDVSVCLWHQRWANLLHDCRATNNDCHQDSDVNNRTFSKKRIHLVARSIMSNKGNVGGRQSSAMSRNHEYTLESELLHVCWITAHASVLFMLI